MLSTVFRRAVLAASIAALSVSACGRQQDQATLDTTDTIGTPAARSDSALTTEVQGRFYADDTVRAGNIDVTTRDGVVTLEGTAASDAARQRAVELAEDVDGVTRVDDRLTVMASNEGSQPSGPQAQGQADASGAVPTGGRPSEGEPAWITTQIQAKYFTDSDVNPARIDVTTTSGGIVELRGEVENNQAKMEAVRLAREVEGVTQVEDRLRVRGETQSATTAGGASEPVAEDDDTSDAWVTTKVQSKYFLDPDVGGLDIDVTTQNGVVTLSGTVDSEAERRTAVAIARNTDGVREVQDQLRMEQSQQSDDTTRGTAGRSLAGTVDDTWITTKIQSQYFIDPDVKGHEINVTTRNGVVTLEGSVASQAASQIAAQIAQTTDGVSRVNNQLTVSPAAQ